jgi:hypothetical protein
MRERLRVEDRVDRRAVVGAALVHAPGAHAFGPGPWLVRHGNSPSLVASRSIAPIWYAGKIQLGKK